MTVEVAIGEVIAQETVTAPATPAMSSAEHFKLFLFTGFLLLLVNFAHPAGGIIDIPVSFFLKNKLHLHANQLAVFKLWAGTPLFLGFLFGFLRDRWSPFGTGDRGHLVIFGLVTAAIYSVVALLKPTYAVLLGGLFVGTMAYQIVGGATAGLISAIGQRQAMAGRMSALISVATSLPLLVSFMVGGLLSEVLEGRDASTAARILFLIAAAMMATIALCGALGPRSVFAAAHAERTTSAFLHDAGRFFRHWPVYPVIVIQLLWQFAPGTGIVLQYHMSNTLHATDAQWGMWNAVFFGSFLPVYIGYGFLCTRVRLGWLLWIGFILAVAQMTPLLFAHTAQGAIIAAVPMGIIGGLAQAALQDLTIRSCPPGLQGTMMMLFVALYYFAVRFGDLFGTFLYDHAGGFTTALWATIGVYALILPALLLVPKRLIATADGQALAIEA
jgi:MFS family permease